MASVFLYHVVGDLTVGKPEMVEFVETETLEAAIQAIGESTECGIPVWKRRSHKSAFENVEMRQQRFVGILNSLEIVSFLAREDCSKDQDRAMKTPVSEVVVPDKSLLKEVDPATRLIDALELMKQGVKRLLIPKSGAWRGMSKRFSIIYNGKWLKNIKTSANNNTSSSSNMYHPSSSSTITIHRKYCCLSREDIIRFVIGCLGALAPVPLSTISSVGAVNPNYCFVEASSPAIEATRKIPHEPSAVAVVEPTLDGQYKIIGDISANKLWKCDYLAAAWDLANLSAGQFVMGVEDHVASRSVPNFTVNPVNGDTNVANEGHLSRPRKFSSRSIGFVSNPTSPSLGVSRSMYRGRSAPLTCKVTSSLAAVMAQMLSHRATHLWVTEAENEDVLVGVVCYADIMVAVSRQSSTAVSEAPTS